MNWLWICFEHFHFYYYILYKDYFSWHTKFPLSTSIVRFCFNPYMIPNIYFYFNFCSHCYNVIEQFVDFNFILAWFFVAEIKMKFLLLCLLPAVFAAPEKRFILDSIFSGTPCKSIMYWCYLAGTLTLRYHMTYWK